MSQQQWSQALRTDNVREVRRILKSNPNAIHMKLGQRQETPLMAGARHGSTQVIKTLLSRKGVDITTRDHDGNTALMLAIRYDHPDVVDAILRHRPNMMSYFSKRILNDTNHHEDTPFMMAAAHGNIDILNRLIEYAGRGVYNELDRTNRENKTALMLAAANGHYHIVQRLCEIGQEYLMNEHGRLRSRGYAFPGKLDRAVRIADQHNHRDVAALLRTHDPLFTTRLYNLHGQDAVPLLYAAHRFGLINDIGRDGDTPLTAAVRNHNDEMIPWLIRFGADPNMKNRKNYSALQIMRGRIRRSNSEEQRKHNDRLLHLLEQGDRMPRIAVMAGLHQQSPPQHGATAKPTVPVFLREVGEYLGTPIRDLQDFMVVGRQIRQRRQTPEYLMRTRTSNGGGASGGGATDGTGGVLVDSIDFLTGHRPSQSRPQPRQIIIPTSSSFHPTLRTRRRGTSDTIDGRLPRSQSKKQK